MINDFVLAHISKKRIFVLIGLWKTLNENKMNRLNQQYSKKRDFFIGQSPLFHFGYCWFFI